MRRLTKDPVFAERVVLDYRRAGLDALRAHGFSTDDIYDIINTAAIYNFNNRVANASGYLPDRENHGLYR